MLLIKDSGISGKGLFSDHCIKKGSVVCRCNIASLRRTTIREIKTWPLNKKDRFLRYAFQAEEGVYLGDDEDFSSDPSFIMNHSCEPNCGHKTLSIIVAIRDISANEELTLDYATVMSPLGLEKPFQCSCKSVECRGKIKKSDCMLPVLQKKYGSYFLSHIDNLIKKSQKALR